MKDQRKGPKLPAGVMRSRVRELLQQGLSQREVADRLGVGKTTVNYHARRLSVPADDRFAKRYDWRAIRRAYEDGMSRRECMREFGFSADAWHKAVKRGAIVPRPIAKPIEEYLAVARPTSRTHLKQRLLKEGLKENRCEICGISDWLGKPLSMQLHHKNGMGWITASKTWSSSAPTATPRPTPTGAGTVIGRRRGTSAW